MLELSVRDPAFGEAVALQVVSGVVETEAELELALEAHRWLDGSLDPTFTGFELGAEVSWSVFAFEHPAHDRRP